MINIENDFIKVSVNKLEWDTAHFGMPMASMEIEVKKEIESYESINRTIQEALQAAKDNGIKHVTLKLNPGLKKVIHVCQENGFRLMDTRIEYIFDYGRTEIKEINDKCTLRTAGKEEMETLIDISKESFKNYIDRFHSDENIDNAKADELYELWVKNSYSGYAQLVYAAEVDGKIVGFSTFKDFVEKDKKGNNIGEIVLSAVSEAARGKGVYTSMINYGVKLGKGKMDYLLVKTQIDNLAVQKAWASLGFKPYKNEYIFHLFNK